MAKSNRSNRKDFGREIKIHRIHPSSVSETKNQNEIPYFETGQTYGNLEKILGGSKAADDDSYNFDFGNEVVFHEVYSGYRYDKKPVNSILKVERRGWGGFDFNAKINYAHKNEPVLTERGREVNFAYYPHVEFSYEGLCKFLEANGHGIILPSDYIGLLKTASILKKNIDEESDKKVRFMKYDKKRMEVNKQKLGWLGYQIEKMYTEAALRQMGKEWIKTFPEKLRIFIERNVEGEGPYLKNLIKYSQTPAINKKDPILDKRLPGSYGIRG